ncbi:MAG TPA: zf-HC2 domain-containing protein, partial [Polyangiales bacterium]|nr:zf-HC2 domain-containing protein [Polyangiales bacterium]
MRLSAAQECVSDLVLDEWASGELDDAARERTERHVAGCASCRARYASHERVRAEFLAAAPSFESHARRIHPQRTHRKLMVGALSVAALAAAVLLAVLPEPQGTRFKGGPSLGYFVKRGTQVQTGDATTVLRPRDSLR